MNPGQALGKRTHKQSGGDGPAAVAGLVAQVGHRTFDHLFVFGEVGEAPVLLNNTDAEGRLILADAVTYAIQLEGAARVVDIATLTGACVAALGFTTAGLLSNDDGFCAALLNPPRPRLYPPGCP